MAEASDLKETLRQCCGSEAWVEAVADACAADPELGLEQAGDTAWADLDADEWKHAFAAHAALVPETGDPPTRDAARVALRLYEERFGHAFVTTGSIRAADELLMRVRIRLGNDLPTEWRIACDEQRRATRLRLAARGDR